MIKAIETRYKGYRFRSRLEARWAVFFDALGIKWEYEKEGFDLDGEYYLPDFWLPQVGMWAEVKGDTFTGRERELCRCLAKSHGHSVLMLCGAPDYRVYYFYEYDSDENIVQEIDCYLTIHYLDEHRFYSCIWEDRAETEAYLRDDDSYIEAVNASRSARFEHGECG